MSEQAFPVLKGLRHTTPSQQVAEVAGGLTKRELFAAMAMQGLRACGDPQCPRNSVPIAEIAVADADALIAELSK